MAWKNSKELGVGLGRTKNGKVVVVASKFETFTRKNFKFLNFCRSFQAYYPRGNIIGQFLNNVKRIN